MQFRIQYVTNFVVYPVLIRFASSFYFCLALQTNTAEAQELPKVVVAHFIYLVIINFSIIMLTSWIDSAEWEANFWKFCIPCWSYHCFKFKESCRCYLWDKVVVRVLWPACVFCCMHVHFFGYVRRFQWICDLKFNVLSSFIWEQWRVFKKLKN